MQGTRQKHIRSRTTSRLPREPLTPGGFAGVSSNARSKHRFISGDLCQQPVAKTAHLRQIAAVIGVDEPITKTIFHFVREQANEPAFGYIGPPEERRKKSDPLPRDRGIAAMGLRIHVHPTPDEPLRNLNAS